MRAKEVLQRYMDEHYPDFDDILLTNVNQHGRFGNVPLNLACLDGNLEDVEALLAAGADVNARGEMGDTPLHIAAMEGHLAIVKRLLEAGADPDAINDDVRSPRDFAVSLNHLEVTATLDAWKVSKR